MDTDLDDAFGKLRAFCHDRATCAHTALRLTRAEAAALAEFLDGYTAGRHAGATAFIPERPQ